MSEGDSPKLCRGHAEPNPPAETAHDGGAAEQRAADILEKVSDAVVIVDRQWRILYANREACRLNRKPLVEFVGKSHWEEFPGSVGNEVERQYRHAMDTRLDVRFEHRCTTEGYDIWFEISAYPIDEGLTIFCRDITARQAAYQALRRDEEERKLRLARESARAEREALINRIGQALRSSQDPEAVQEVAVDLLGKALGADRCYLGRYDLERGVVTIGRDHRRADLPSVQGIYHFVNTVEMFNELYHSSNASVIVDAYTAGLSAQTIANMESLQLRSRVSVALVESGYVMATLTAAMSDGPREWTEDDAALVEAVATQLRAAVQMARAMEREHNIAAQLQAALTPSVPDRVAGLGLAKYYEAALREAEVGGDFYDIFSIEKGCTALVVGDLSGKGLAAASQVSTVRNMLRAYLYSHPRPAEAVTELNRVLSENDLLTGFTTLFVGLYDSSTRQLNYVNCGQEPALLRRASMGSVEQLETTGPILGCFYGAGYQEASAKLGPGDAVAIFTDGLTEAGAPRMAMLGIEGVAASLAQPLTQSAFQSATEVADELAVRLITEVERFAPAGARDDLCLLIAVVR